MRWIEKLLVGTILLLPGASPHPTEAAPPGSNSSKQKQSNQKQRGAGDREPDRIRRELDRPVTWRFTELPLGEWVRIVARDHRLPLVLDVRACEAAAIGTDSPLTVNLPPLPLRDAIRQTLGPLDLTLARDHGALLVTTRDRSEYLLETHVYPVADLVRYRFRGGYDSDFQPIIDAIQNTTGKPEPGWVDDGGVGNCEQFPSTDCLVISTTADVHAEVATLLENLRRARRLQGSRPQTYSTAPWWNSRQGSPW